jgi:hypothetical protein
LAIRYDVRPGYLYHVGHLTYIYLRTEIETGPVAVTEGESICIRIQNNSDETVYVSVFIVSTNGDTYLLSKAWTMGVVLKPGGSERLAKRQQPLRGISMAWPESVSRLQPIEENLVLVITSEEVDLRAFHNVSPEYDVTQQARGPADPAVRGSRAAYDVVRLRYSLIPRSGIVEQRG